MKHIDILLHVLTLISGVTTALLGYLLYLKYRVKEIRHYTVFILSTTFTVAFTTVYNYLSSNASIDNYTIWHAVALLVFEVLILLINYSFTHFSLGIINKPFKLPSKIFFGLPCSFVLLTLISLVYAGCGGQSLILPQIYFGFFYANLFFLFLTFILYSIQIGLNLKFIENLDLKRALKLLALLFLTFIPLQAVMNIFSKQIVLVMLTRNLFYITIDVISIVFAAKYFFIEAPSIIEQIAITDSFISKYSITSREKEIMELLLSGFSIKEIAGKLDRSFKTVNNHIYNIYKKTNVTSKMELLYLVKETSL
ncbi:MAG: helix-turn-helix transcriptional regulator [Bacillota bacterium]